MHLLCRGVTCLGFVCAGVGAGDIGRLWQGVSDTGQRVDLGIGRSGCPLHVVRFVGAGRGPGGFQ